MRFMILVKVSAQAESGESTQRQLSAALAPYHEELARAGVLLDAAGLWPSSKGWRIRHEGGRATLDEGPFSESRERVAAYTIITVRSREEALEWTRRFPPPHGALAGVEIEVRQMFEPDESLATPGHRALV